MDNFLRGLNTFLPLVHNMNQLYLPNVDAHALYALSLIHTGYLKLDNQPFKNSVAS
jgi:hypothetical protein